MTTLPHPDPGASAGALDPLGMTLPAFSDAARDRGFGPGQALRAYQDILREGKTEAVAGRGRVVAKATIAPIVNELSEAVSEGVTTKFVQEVPPLAAPGTGSRAPVQDPSRAQTGPLPVPGARLPVPSLRIESVIIPMVGRLGTRTHTLCVSSQVGCAMGCTFCETAQMGLIRSLTAEEIVGQWWAATHVKKARIDNIVFMGMGEPLDNIDEVVRAIGVLADHHGAGVPMANITISTVGRVDGLRKLDEVVKQEGWRRLGLAVSVNAPNDKVRSELMPINRRYDMAELREALLSFRRGSHRKICFEYVLIPGVNDGREHARELAEYLAPFTKPSAGSRGKSPAGLVNLIPYNPRRDSPWPAPREEDVDAFMGWLSEGGLFVKRRRTKGRAMMGACGQLGTAEIRKRKYVGVTLDRVHRGERDEETKRRREPTDVS